MAIIMINLYPLKEAVASYIPYTVYLYNCYTADAFQLNVNVFVSAVLSHSIRNQYTYVKFFHACANVCGLPLIERTHTKSRKLYMCHMYYQ